ncbi:MAG: exodeoxyribonuclease VII large subunit [Bacteroidetes bacterium]|nr:MAG: exodeoxyribonuclease VII large subunit [Bacteroidota bacterium]
MENRNSIIKKTEERKIFSLYQLNKSIKNALDSKAGDNLFWVKAEIAKFTLSRTGHAYIDLVEEEDGERRAAIRATLWRRDYERIVNDLGDSASSVLKIGSEIVFQCRIKFHEVHGLSLEIEDIDLSFMLGELERRKAQTIAIIKKDGVQFMNSSIPLPTVIQQIAIVGSPGTSGFRDFVHHVIKNEGLFRFKIEVFESPVQGTEAPKFISQAIKNAEKISPDAIVIIRGGGSPLDLDCFNDLNLALTIGNTYVPILTGIGHETDSSIADFVAHRSFKTPTDVGDFIVNRSNTFSALLVDIATRIGSRSKTVLHKEDAFLKGAQITLRDIPKRLLNERKTLFEQLKSDLNREASKVILRQKEALAGLASTMDLLKPEKTMARGFSIVRHNNKIIRDAKNISSGDIIKVKFHIGEINATVK